MPDSRSEINRTENYHYVALKIGLKVIQMGTQCLLHRGYISIILNISLSNM